MPMVHFTSIPAPDLHGAVSIQGEAGGFNFRFVFNNEVLTDVNGGVGDPVSIFNAHPDIFQSLAQKRIDQLAKTTPAFLITEEFLK